MLAVTAGALRGYARGKALKGLREETRLADKVPLGIMTLEGEPEKHTILRIISTVEPEYYNYFLEYLPKKENEEGWIIWSKGIAKAIGIKRIDAEGV